MEVNAHSTDFMQVHTCTPVQAFPLALVTTFWTLMFHNLVPKHTYFINKTFKTSRVHNGESNATYRTGITYIGSEVSGIM